MKKEHFLIALVMMAGSAIADITSQMKRVMPQICHNYIASNIQPVAAGKMVLVSGSQIHPFDVPGLYGMKLEYLLEGSENFQSISTTYVCMFDQRGIVEDMYGVDAQQYGESQTRVLLNMGKKYREYNGIK